jgi:hypothetical protein
MKAQKLVVIHHWMNTYANFETIAVEKFEASPVKLYKHSTGFVELVSATKMGSINKTVEVRLSHCVESLCHSWNVDFFRGYVIHRPFEPRTLC